ncbi:MarR family winged helix-turn-helix transcriptional regulator [Frondihabitans sp. VKM Ac-2883]|uniref:MarR family winged helix-turn-helix transcriptional regulator n=1 Tax=Frondihabitans sp. VKM Ac-2883 TaxID=2783823 RepID=UPI00188C6051|nr:MarR family transcriptional regulator [Frondihabitans sp. VKM Ac-2883]MBF4574617.1 MarR family transcriptional regulator [Frondihabitans sp. VKM Ac-2883]
MSSCSASLVDEHDDNEPQVTPVAPATPVALLEAVSALQTADALLRWRLRDLLHLRANEIMALEFLARLNNLDQPVRALDIARALGVTNGASTLIVARLMERGLVTRTENPRDGRGHLLHLTVAAITALDDALGDSRHGIRALLEGLSPRESKRIIMILGELTASLDLGGLQPAA